MLVEKFWNVSTGRLNQINAAIDASNFFFNMLEIFQMYFTFPSVKNIATQRSFKGGVFFGGEKISLDQIVSSPICVSYEYDN